MAPEVHDLSYYFKCMIGGALACGLTHTAINTLYMAKSKSIRNIPIPKTENTPLTLGWAPTLIGYSMQGLVRFGFYEIFKDVYKGIVGAENAEKYKKTGWLVASGSAEVIADCLLCPWEAIKLKIQLSRPGFEYPSELRAAITKLRAEEGNSFCHSRRQRFLQGFGSSLGQTGPLHDHQVCRL